MAEKVAKFRFLGYKVLESSIKVSEDPIVDAHLSVNFHQQISYNEDEQKMRLELTSKINDDKSLVDIEVKTIGFFEYDNTITPQERDGFFRVNAPAILFPYVRAYVSSLTALSGINPITLPTLNLSKQ